MAKKTEREMFTAGFKAGVHFHTTAKHHDYNENDIELAFIEMDPVAYRRKYGRCAAPPVKTKAAKTGGR